MFIEPPKRKFWTREMEAIKVPADRPDEGPGSVAEDVEPDGPVAGPDASDGT